MSEEWLQARYRVSTILLIRHLAAQSWVVDPLPPFPVEPGSRLDVFNGCRWHARWHFACHEVEAAISIMKKTWWLLIVLAIAGIN
jgi:hypothetical protein